MPLLFAPVYVPKNVQYSAGESAANNDSANNNAIAISRSDFMRRIKAAPPASGKRANSFCFCAARSTRTLFAFMKSNFAAALVAITAALNVSAWDYEGHRIVNELAVDALPNDFPAFAKTPEARERIAFLAGEADRWRNSTNRAAAHDLSPEHYFDIDHLADYGVTLAQLTPFRYDFTVLLAQGRAKHPEHFPTIDPAKNTDRTRELVGFLPWAINDYYAKLESGFSYLKALEESGTRDEIAQARQNIIYIMGVMGHFTGDAAQPLHTTKHHHGWVGPNPNSYRTNATFHAWIDGTFIRLAEIKQRELRPQMRPARLLWPTPPESAFGNALEFINEQHRLVEPLYALDRDGAMTPRNERVKEGREFIGKQLVKGGQWLADLWYSAYKHAPEDKFLTRELKNRSTRTNSPPQTAP
jgi:hypothetical protein